MRRLLWLVCIAALVAGGALAATPEALIKDGSALAPLRAVAEWLGAELVGFDQNTSTIHIVVGEKSVALIIGQTTATVNKVAVTMPAAPILREGVSYVPLRFVGEVFGATVAWDGAAGTVTVVNPATGEKLVIPAHDVDAPPPTNTAAGATTVLVTASGKKYHVEGCSSLSISKAPLSLAEAVAKGYTPCTRCEAPTLKPEAVVIPAPAAQSPTPTNPPPAADPIVYITKSGKKYHAEGCSSLSNSKVAVRLSEAKAKELEPCSRCKPDGDGGKP